MQVLFIVSSNKYTGAAAAAEHCCRALHAAGVEAKLLFVGGNNLQDRLAGFEWALPDLRKERRLADLKANLARIRDHALESDVVVCHLPHDHTLCHLSRAWKTTPLVRNFRNAKHVAGGPLRGRLYRHLGGATFANTALQEQFQRKHGQPPPAATFPVPLEERFQPGRDGNPWRRNFGIHDAAPVLGMIGKVAAGRGFDTLIQTAARLSHDLHVLIIGHGEARPRIEALATSLGLAGHVHWAGYRGRELPELYAAMDVVLFPAAGSDHGHRAISEAQGCGRPVVAAALPGVEDLIEDGVTGRIVPGSPTDLAAAVSEILSNRILAERLGHAAALAVESRRFPAVGRRLAAFLEEIAS
ncbi:MAG: glycosyltransferase family 4 protein [Acidobacteria bacterium]|nr:glycosyltransferase family 4 protein [Acidobacteriota bacterium]